ncbi:MAG: ATP-binding protein, partial [Myxococcales bacterium]|nr:ATP-binding protein [Myxococcales bacterium]
LIHGDLYEGAYERASERFKDAWPALKGSMLLRVQVVRAEAHQLRAMTALACVQEGHIRGSSRARTLAMVAGEIKEMQAEDEPWIHALATLLQASLDGLRGDAAGLRRQVEAAAKRFDDCAMALHAAVARRQLGILDGGSAGGEAVARADAFMTGQRIRNPQRVAACLAPALVKA